MIEVEDYHSEDYHSAENNRCWRGACPEKPKYWEYLSPVWHGGEVMRFGLCETHKLDSYGLGVTDGAWWVGRIAE